MRLLVISQYFWPEDFRVNDLVSELIRRGHDVTVLTGRPNYPGGKVFPEFRRHPEQFSTYQGAPIVRVPILPRGTGSIRLVLNYLSYAASATVFGISWMRGRQFDAIFVFEVSPVTVGLPAIALRRLYGWPVAFWVLDQWPETLSAVGAVKSKIALDLIGRLVSFIYRRCDVVLAPSKSLVATIRDRWHARRVVYFPNWGESAYLDGAAVAAPEVPIRQGSFDIMFAGNIGESQGFPAILDAAERLGPQSRIRWLIVGDGRMAGWVRDEVSRRGLQDRVLLLGRYPADRMSSFYRHASALLVSLKSEPIFSITIPGKVQSYLAFGLPILAMLDGEGARVVDDAGAGLTCAAGDSRRLAEIALQMAAMTEAERAVMGEHGQAYARKEFDRDTLITRLETLLAGLARPLR